MRQFHLVIPLLFPIACLADAPKVTSSSESFSKLDSWMPPSDESHDSVKSLRGGRQVDVHPESESVWEKPVRMLSSTTEKGDKTIEFGMDVDEADERPWPIFSRSRDEVLTERERNGFELFTFRRRASEAESNENGHSDLSVHVSFQDVYDTLIFLAVITLLGRLAEFFGMPSLLGEIIAGFLLGPPLADYVPFPEAMVLFGEIGLIMLLLEAGVELDLAQLKISGTRSVLIAITGAIIPLCVGLGIAIGAGQNVRTGIAAGASFSPTSLGVASNVLSAGNALNTPVGQLIVASCVIDDVIGLILLSMLEVLIKEEPKIYEYFVPLISSFGYLIVLGWSGLTWMPKLIQNKLLPLFSKSDRDFVAFVMMNVLLLAYLPLLYFSKSSYLTGAFLAGLTFSQIPKVHATFINRFQMVFMWLLRIFFSCTIGFQVPVKNFSNPWVISWGFALYAAVICKLPLGFYVPKFQEHIPKDFPFNPYIRDFLITGFAMTSRGEMNFILASFALSQGLFDPDFYSAVIFAVLLSTVTSPFFLLYTIKYFNKKCSEYLAKKQEGDVDEDQKMSLYLVVQLCTDTKWGLNDKVQKTLKDMTLSIIDHRSWHPRGMNSLVVTEIYVQDNNLRIDVPELTPSRRTVLNKDRKIAEELTFSANKIPEDKEEEKEEEKEVHSGEEEKPSDEVVIAQRCAEIRSALLVAIGRATAKVDVVQWHPHAMQSKATGKSTEEMENILREEAEKDLKKKEDIETNVDDKPSSGLLTAGRGVSTPAIQKPKIGRAQSKKLSFRTQGRAQASMRSLRRHGLRRRISSPVMSAGGILNDRAVQDAVKRGYHAPSEQIDTSGGMAYGVSRRKLITPQRTSDSSMPTIEERLGGHIRHELDVVEEEDEDEEED